MYYDRYLRSIQIPNLPQNLRNLTEEKLFPDLVAWMLTDPVGASQGINFSCYSIIYDLSKLFRKEVTDDRGVLCYYKILCHPIVTTFTNALGQGVRIRAPHLLEQVLSNLGHALRYAFHMLSFAEQGFRRYQVSDGLALELAETAFPDLKCQDVRLPYPSLYIEVPKVLGFEIHNRTTGLHPLEGVFLSEDGVVLHRTDGERARSGKIEMKDIQLEAGRALHSMLIGTSKNPQDDMDDATCVTTMDMVDDRPLEQEVTATARAADLDENFKRFPVIMAWITNVLLYSTWPDALLEQAWANPKAEKLWKAAESAASNSQAKKLRQKLQEHHAADRITVLGRNILVDRTVPNYRGVGQGEGRSLEIRIRVQGHMKRQPCGPKSAERKIIWIRPYWKGPEDGPVKFSSHELVARHGGTPC